MTPNRWSSVRIIVGGSLIALTAVVFGMINWDIPYWFIQVVSVLFVFPAAILYERRIYMSIVLIFIVTHLGVDLYTGGRSFLLGSDAVQWLSIIAAGEVIYQISSQRRRADVSNRQRIQELEVIADENARLYKEVQQLAYIDALTGINNRRRLSELLDDEYRRAIRYQRPLSLMLVDIDHFKKINDSYGHAAGDEVLRWFANQCSVSIRQKLDLLGRFGGDEFAIIYPEADLASALGAAERLRPQIIGHPLQYNDTELQITFSAGIASLPLDEEIGLEQLVERADKALYFAKEKRNCIAYWDDKADMPQRKP
jgi:diguanylate cyclase (GGDEF)-like protein